MAQRIWLASLQDRTGTEFFGPEPKLEDSGPRPGCGPRRWHGRPAEPFPDPAGPVPVRIRPSEAAAAGSGGRRQALEASDKAAALAEEQAAKARAFADEQAEKVKQAAGGEKKEPQSGAV